MMTRIKTTNLVPWMMKNYETRDPIDTDKQSPSYAAEIETALFAYIAAVPIVTTKDPVFHVLNYLLVYYQFIHQ